MRTDYTSKMEVNTEEATRLECGTGILIDKFTMLDRKTYNRINQLCQQFPLRPDLQKRRAPQVFRLSREADQGHQDCRRDRSGRGRQGGAVPARARQFSQVDSWEPFHPGPPAVGARHVSFVPVDG